MPIMAKDIRVGDILYYIDKDAIYPYPKQGGINLVNDTGTVVIGGKERWSWELG